MQTRMAYMAGLLWAALLIAGAFRPQHPGTGALPRPETGFTAPPVSLTTPGGDAISLGDYRGKAVFLNFWASWCGPCRLEMPEIQRLSLHLPAGTAILTVNLTDQESAPEAVAAFLKSAGYTFPVAMDVRGDVGQAYRVVSLPTSYFVNPEGVVTARVNGPLPHAAMRDYLQTARGWR